MALPATTRDDLLRGRELADIGQCCPTAFTTGNLANFLNREVERIGPAEVARKYAYVTAGSCGACRFGQYHQSYEMMLRNLGMEDFRMFLVAQGAEQEDGGGLEIDAHILLGVIYAILMADVIQDLEYQTRPYEVEPGATDRAAKLAVEEIHEAMRSRPVRKGTFGPLAWHLTTRHFTRALERAKRHFEGIELDRLRVKPVVKITGEFYLQTVEGAPNHDIHAWLQKEGAEVYPAAVAVWLDYLLRFEQRYYDERDGLVPRARLKRAGLRLAARLLRSRYDGMRRALGGVPREMPQQDELSQLAAPYYDHRLSGGEGDMLIGKSIWAHIHHKAHMICELSPYSCLPNTMSIGAMAAVLGKHPDLLYAPLEIKGDSEVHALSRCQMVLTEAKTRARKEYEQALEGSGLTEDKARELMDRRPEMKSPFWIVPDHGAAGTAANVVLELGGGKL